MKRKIILIITIGLATISNAAQFQFVKAYQWNAIRTVVAVDSLLYCGMDEGVQIFNVSNPTDPRILGQGIYEDDIGEYAPISRFAVGGGFAFSSRYSGGLIVTDVSDPRKPRKVLKVDGQIYSVGAGESVACFAVAGYTKSMSNRDFAGIGVFDLDRAGGPGLAGELPESGSIDDIHIVGGQAFLAVNDKPFGLKSASKFKGRLKIIDLSDPARPSGIGACELDEPIGAVAVDGRYAFLLTGRTGLVVVDIGNPRKAKVVARRSCQVDGRYPDIAIWGRCAFLTANAGDGHCVFDISNPLKPRLIETGKSEINYSRLTIAGNFMYAWADESPVTVFNVSDPGNIRKVGQIGGVNQFEDIAVAGNYAYVTDLKSGLKVIDIKASPGEEFVSELELKKHDRGRLIAYGDYLYVTNWNYLLAINIADPGEPRRASDVSLGYHIPNLKVYGNRLFASADYCDFCDFEILDLSNPATPKSLKTMVLGSDTFGGIAVWETLLIAASHGSGVKVFNIADIANPSFVSSYDTKSAEDIEISGECAFVADYGAGLIVLDISDPARLRKISSIMPTGFHRGFHGEGGMQIAVRDELVFVLEPYVHMLFAVDISDPLDPQIVSTYKNFTGGHFAVMEDEIFLQSGRCIQVLKFVE